MISVNEYFEGGVKSLGYDVNGLPSTVGVMNKGKYEFGTSQHETITVIEGEMNIQFPGQSEWKTFKAGDSFEMDANVKFGVDIPEIVSYLCLYR